MAKRGREDENINVRRGQAYSQDRFHSLSIRRAASLIVIVRLGVALIDQHCESPLLPAIEELCKGVKRLHPTTSTSLSGGFPENLKVSDSVGTIKHVYAPINHRMADGSVSGAPRSSDKDQEHQMQSDKSLYSDFNAFLFQLHTERMARQSQSKAEPNIDESGL